MKSNDLVSVIINTRNGHKYINKTIESVLNQIHKNFELIVYDNMSSPFIESTICHNDDRIKISKAIEMLDTQIAEKEVAMQKTHEENSLSDIIEAGMKIE